MNQKDRRIKRDVELKEAKELIKKRSNGICEHCKKNYATDFAHTIRKNRDNYKFYSDPNNMNHWCRKDHDLFDKRKVKEFAEINIENFFNLMDFLLKNNQLNAYYTYMDIYNE